jgi:hypothetical protein
MTSPRSHHAAAALPLTDGASREAAGSRSLSR